LRPPKRFPSSTQATRVPEDAPIPHMEWFHSTVFPKNATAEEVLCAEPINVAVGNLTPRTAYEVKLYVRYARLGVRRWTEALDTVAVTKKMNMEAKRMMELTGSVKCLGSFKDSLSSTGFICDRPWPTAASSARAVSCGFRETMRGGTASAITSPQHAKNPSSRLAPLGPRTHQRTRDTSTVSSGSAIPCSVLDVPQSGQDLCAASSNTTIGSPCGPSAELAALLSPAELEEWVAFQNTDVDHVLGGTSIYSDELTLPKLTASNQPADSALLLPPRPPGGLWRTVGKPPVPTPVMPSGNHSAALLDLCGRKKPF